jgi:polar amino acid transport system permease protein
VFDFITFRWDSGFAISILPQLMRAAVVTIQATVIGFLLALVIGLAFALLRRGPRPVAWPVGFVVEFLRSTPLLVQLYVLFFMLPGYGIRLDAFTTGVLGLGLHYGAYLSEVYRAGIASVDEGQWEAATALNFGRAHVWRTIILPQALPPMVPAFGNYFIVMFKETPLLSAITVTELMQTAKIIGARSFNYVEPYTLVGLIFLVLSYPSALLVNRLEARLARNR